jgi:hypothetical protein
MIGFLSMITRRDVTQIILEMGFSMVDNSDQDVSFSELVLLMFVLLNTDLLSPFCQGLITSTFIRTTPYVIIVVALLLH